MNRPLTAVFAALESLLVVGIGVGIPVVSLTFLWAFQYGLQIDWVVFWQAGVDVWLVGHGADLTLTLSKSAAAATGISGAGAPIVISIAALGFALTTVLLGARAGRRIAETSHRAIGSGVAVLAFALASAIVTATASRPGATVSLAQGIVLPTLVFAIPLLAAAEVNRRRRDATPDPLTALLLRGVEAIPSLGRSIGLVSLRAGAAVAVIVFAVAGAILALLLLTNYASIISLYEGAHAGVLGGLALTIGQIALVPNAVAWVASWLIGPGFALGEGSSVSPLGTTLGPMPAVPFLGALPTSTPAFAFVGLLVPVVASFVVVTLMRGRIERALGARDSLLFRAVVGVSTGVVAGLIIGGVAGVSAGSAGPGRLASVGPDAWVVGLFAALEVGIPAVLALVVKSGAEAIGDLAQVVGERLPERASAARDKPKSESAVSDPDRSRSAGDRDAGDTGGPRAPETADGLPSLDTVLPRDKRSSDSRSSDTRSPDDVPTERLDGFTR
ncbi:cell division protein PerM [Frondihabitans sp. Leaf304]|uniref:cell division protein PerM n=1 Tax=Frondihabitans sp. Leaf304 TaxID=1736329 RepID=UPI0019100ACA|nr:DUF6350 family protein [Frondihabitans sp. Leaf304]